MCLIVFVNAKPELYEELARIAASLASPTRLRALNLLFQGEKSVDQLASELGESEANAAAHIKSLRNSGLLVAEKRGKRVFLSVSSPEVLALFMALRRAGEETSPALALLQQATEDELSSALRLEDLEREIQQGKSLLLDLRPAEEYSVGHLPGARSMPLAELSGAIAELPKRRRILVYCRGKYCPNARRGARQLRDAQLRAERLAFGVPEWVSTGRLLHKEINK